MYKRKTVKRLVSDNTELMSCWNWEKNNQLGFFPDKLTVGSGRKVWWKCSVCGHEWQSTVDNRRKRNCPNCIGRALIKGQNDLATIAPDIASQWHPTKNGDMLPEDCFPNSNNKVWWICENGHEWEARIQHRAKKKCGCPYCVGRAAIEGVNDLLTVKPELAAEWDYEKNGNLKPNMVMPRSGKYAWWVCPKGHSYKSKIAHRSVGVGCPICADTRRTSFAEQAFYYYIKQVFPDAINRCRTVLDSNKELDIYIPSIKTAIEYDGVYWHQNGYEKELKKYEECREKGIKLIRIKEDINNNKGFTCDYAFSCENMYDLNHFGALIQRVLDRLDPRSNPMIFEKGEDVKYYHSPVRVNLFRDEWKIKKYLEDTRKSFINEKPELMKEWNSEKNGEIKPAILTKGSSQKVWWKCAKCGFEWSSSVYNRVKLGSNCPECARKRQRKKVLQFSIDGQFIKEWPSTAEVTRQTGITGISLCCRGKRHKAGGYVWKYADNIEE